MKIVFMGSSAFAIPCLKVLIEKNFILQKTNTEDARKKNLYLTDSANSMLNKVLKPSMEKLSSAFLKSGINSVQGLNQVLSKLTSKPADLLRLKEGNLSTSSPADFIIFDPEKPWKIIGDNFISKSKNTPFDGHLAQGTIIKTVINGRTVFESNKE